VRYVKGYSLRFLYCLMLLAAAASVLLKQLGNGELASIIMLGAVGTLCVIIISRMAKTIYAKKTGQKA